MRQFTWRCCTCLHWVIKYGGAGSIRTSSLISNRWRRRIASPRREHRLNPYHQWEKQRACRSNARHADCNYTSSIHTSATTGWLLSSHGSVVGRALLGRRPAV